MYNNNFKKITMEVIIQMEMKSKIKSHKMNKIKK